MKKQPKYQEITNYFIAQIESGALPKGSPLPAEEIIRQRFHASHMTITKSMSELMTHGYIRRIKGKGSFADDQYKNRVIRNMDEIESLSDVIRHMGLEPSSDLLEYSVLKAKDIPDIQALLHVADQDFLHFFIRARFGDDSLVCLSYSYISQNILPTIDIKKLEGSFNRYLDEIGINRSYGYTELGVALPDEKQAELIGSDRIPLLKQTILWNVNQQPFELTIHFFLGDYVSFRQNRCQSSVRGMNQITYSIAPAKESIFDSIEK